MTHFKVAQPNIALKCGGRTIYICTAKTPKATRSLRQILSKTERLRKSAIVNMQKLLNRDVSEKRKVLKRISNYMPVNYDCMQSISL